MSGLDASPSSIFARATAAADSLRRRLPDSLKSPLVAIICGSGLGGLQHALVEQSKIEVPYENINGMPKLSVKGHEGKMVFGFLKSKDNAPIDTPVLLLVGRAHYYEGHSMEIVTYATRVCRCLDIKILMGLSLSLLEALLLCSLFKYLVDDDRPVTNAAGGLNPTYRVGDLVLLCDHLNLAGLAGNHPLRGPNEDEFGTRFPALSDAYDLDLRRRVHRAWRSMPATDKKLHEGIYGFVAGPSFETRAECRLFRMMGADVVGMSTVPEVITARHCGIRVLAISLVTNNAVLEAGPSGDAQHIQGMSERELEEYLAQGKANHEEVLAAGLEAAKLIEALITLIVTSMGGSGG